MKELTLKQFITYFKEDRRTEKKFCFILGAGASKSSGIPTGYELVKEWVADLEKSDEEFTKWLSDEKINSDDYASHYSKIFDRRYPINKKDGYAFLEEKMENKEPSCGYSFLAQILAKGKHNVVITTNFDSLTEDALFIYTNKKPLVIGHASLAGYISSNSSRPLVVKIHHDLLLSPKSSEREISDLDKNFIENLTDVFKYYSPLVIGYGGNDGSLMDFLGDLEHIGDGIFWFYMEGTKPTKSIVEFVDKKKGHFVPIKGFDELMIQLGDALGFQKLDTTIEKNAKDRADRYRKQFETITKGKDIDSETKQAMDNIAERGTKNWWNYILMASKEDDPEKANEIFLQGLQEFPKSVELLGAYANYLYKDKKQYDAAELYFLNGLEADVNNANLNCDYAIFLHNVRKQYDKAEEYYLNALKIDQNDAYFNKNYANFLENIRKDYDKAENHYSKAVEIDSNDAYYNCIFAIFLENNRKKYDEAEKYYLRAIELDYKDGYYYYSYASFLVNIKGNYDEAEKYYLKAIEFGLNDSYNFSLYAYFLESIRKNYDEAEKYYLKAIDVDFKNGYNYCGYASFLENIRKQYDKAEEYYLKGIEFDQENMVLYTYYATFLKDIRKDYEKTEEYYKKILELDPDNIIYNTTYALFLFDIKKDYNTAEKYFQIALKLDPNDANLNGNYAKYLIVQYKKEDTIQYIVKAFELNNGKPNDLELELWFYCYAIFSNDYPESKAKIEELLAKGIRSEGWDLSGVLKVAEEENHPDYPKLVEYAKMISEVAK